MPVDEIVAVHANAHYTYIFDGKAKLFCPLAIGEVESRLDTGRFVRVHRSHIVNIDRIIGLKRAATTGLVDLGTGALYRAGEPRPVGLAQIPPVASTAGETSIAAQRRLQHRLAAREHRHLDASRLRQDF